jgi:hypothetical protein
LYITRHTAHGLALRWHRYSTPRQVVRNPTFQTTITNHPAHGARGAHGAHWYSLPLFPRDMSSGAAADHNKANQNKAMGCSLSKGPKPFLIDRVESTIPSIEACRCVAGPMTTDQQPTSGGLVNLSWVARRETGSKWERWERCERWERWERWERNPTTATVGLRCANRPQAAGCTAVVQCTSLAAHDPRCSGANARECYAAAVESKFTNLGQSVDPPQMTDFAATAHLIEHYEWDLRPLRSTRLSSAKASAPVCLRLWLWLQIWPGLSSSLSSGSDPA